MMVTKHHQTTGLMSRTMAVHVRYKSLHISLPSSAKQQREILCSRARTATTNFSPFHSAELNAVSVRLA